MQETENIVGDLINQMLREIRNSLPQNNKVKEINLFITFSNDLKFSAMVFVWVEVGSDDDSVRKLSACQRQLGLLAFGDAAKLDEDFSEPGNIHARHRPGDFNGPNCAIFATFLSDVLQNVLVLLFILELVWGNHVEQTKNFCRLTRA